MTVSIFVILIIVALIATIVLFIWDNDTSDLTSICKTIIFVVFSFMLLSIVFCEAITIESTTLPQIDTVVRNNIDTTYYYTFESKLWKN